MRDKGGSKNRPRPKSELYEKMFKSCSVLLTLNGAEMAPFFILLLEVLAF